MDMKKENVIFIKTFVEFMITIGLMWYWSAVETGESLFKIVVLTYLIINIVIDLERFIRALN